MHPQYEKSLYLRLKGKSYNEIARELGVSKGSLSNWFKNLRLSKSAQILIEKKVQLARSRGLFENNRRRTENIKVENQKILELSRGRIQSLSGYELLLVGSALYWAEGYNRQDKVSSPFLSFGNSNAGMIALFLRFAREILRVTEERVRPCIQIHKNVDPVSAIEYWAKITNIT